MLLPVMLSLLQPPKNSGVPGPSAPLHIDLQSLPWVIQQLPLETPYHPRSATDTSEISGNFSKLVVLWCHGNEVHVHVGIYRAFICVM